MPPIDPNNGQVRPTPISCSKLMLQAQPPPQQLSRSAIGSTVSHRRVSRYSPLTPHDSHVHPGAAHGAAIASRTPPPAPPGGFQHVVSAFHESHLPSWRRPLRCFPEYTDNRPCVLRAARRARVARLKSPSTLSTPSLAPRRLPSSPFLPLSRATPSLCLTVIVGPALHFSRP